MESFCEMCGDISDSQKIKIAIMLAVILVILLIITGVIKFEKKYPFIKFDWNKK